MTVWLEKLNEAVAAYPSTASNRRRSRLIQVDGGVEIAFRFNRSPYDQIDLLLVEFIADRVSAKRCDPSDGKSATVCYRCGENEAKQFGGRLNYASTLPMAQAPPFISHEQTPLSSLLSRALAAFTQEFQAKPPKNGLPSLPVWSNILQVVPKSGVELKALERLAILSTRTVRVVTHHSQDLGWLDIKKPPGRGSKAVVSLTDEGLRMRQAGARRLRRVEKSWSERFGRKFEHLINSLAAIEHSLELEFPNYITGYGIGDEALTGGDYLPAEEGPPRIPGRGTEWPVVIRAAGKRQSKFPLSTLLSRVLTSFALDYEGDLLGRLGLTVMFFQHLPDAGMTLAEARSHYAITGNGTSLHERHMNIVIEPGKPSDGSRRVYPTPKTRLARDAYPHQVARVESRWHELHGSSTILALRSSLESIDESFESDLPDYPNTTSWMVPYYGPFLIQN